jgi:NAD(P)-dependent dehydrogenase (short-subunit alcohol dehydrogenase family)
LIARKAVAEMASELFSLEGKKIAITGAAGHLGSALAAVAADAGADLYLVDRDEPGLEAVAASLGPRAKGAVEVFVTDLEDEASRKAFVEALGSKTSRLDGLVHNAAFVGTSDLEGWAVGFKDQSLETWRRALEVNVTAPFHLTQLMLPLLDAGNKPSVVTIGSIHGMLGPDWKLYQGLAMANPAAYATSKAALIQLTTWLATTLAPAIRCNSVSPGGLERSQPSKFVARYRERTPMGRMGSENDIVGSIVYLLSDASSYVTGQNIVVDGGYSSW